MMLQVFMEVNLFLFNVYLGTYSLYLKYTHTTVNV